jgi:hypothetical protein
MPRLRYKKNFNFTARDVIEPEDLSSEDLSSSSGDSEISASGEHFLSNKNMVSSLELSEIELAIKYHQVQIKLLEEEINGRKDGSRAQISKDWYGTNFTAEMFDKPFSKRATRRQNIRNSSYNRISPKKDNSNTIKGKSITRLAEQIKALGLTAEDLKKLWSDRTYGA